jgi:ribonuclease J
MRRARAGKSRPETYTWAPRSPEEAEVNDDDARAVPPDGARPVVAARNAGDPKVDRPKGLCMIKKRGHDELVFLPLGGVGEIGMNLAMYGLGPREARQWLIVDFGLTFASEFDEPGVDLVYPDIRFAEAERKNIVGIVITHAHEDHFGALLDLWPKLKVPLFMSPFAAGLLKAKAAGEAGAPDIPVKLFKAGDRLQLGDFDIEAINVAHSIPESMALALRTRHGTVIHTGDWKIDPTPVLGLPTDLPRLAEIGAEGVAALICDSTNVTRSGRSPSERDVALSMREIMAAAPGRVGVTTFASNVGRIRAVAEAAQACERHVVVLGRAMKRSIDVGRELGMLDGLPEFLSEDAFGYLPRDKVVALFTGSQGESRAALARISAGDHRHITFAPGDTMIFSSRTIPGNEKSVGVIVNRLAALGVTIITDRDALVHVSGHPRRDELAEMYRAVRPALAVPAHGEALHLNMHAEFARSQGVEKVIVAGNGKIVRIAGGDPAIIDEAPVGRLFKDGRLIVAPEVSGVAERRKAAFAGAVVVAVVLDAKGSLVGEPDAILIGLPEEDADGETFEDVCIETAERTVDNLPRPKRRDPDSVADAVKKAVRAAVAERWGKKPIVEVMVLDV